MLYHLSETDVNQIKAWLPSLTEYYSETDAVKLLSVFQKAITTAFLDDSDIYMLLEYLPRIIPKRHEETNCTQEEQNADWNVYLDEKQAAYKREMEKLYQALSNWVFLQNSLYRKNGETVGKPIDRTPELGIVQKI